MLNTDIKPIINSAISKAGEEQPWDGYYLVRGSEFENLLKVTKLNSLGRVLDLGCGIGFISYILSLVSKEVIAMDLYSPNIKTHSLGIDSTRRFISKMGGENIFLLASSSEHLPFKDETFDTVFLSYVLQYIRDKTIALNEIKRVIKRGGNVILILPNFMERIYAFFQFYVYFVMRFFRIIASKILKDKESATTKKEAVSFHKQNYKYFLFPEPDGAYKNFIIEIIMYMPLQWNRMFRKIGFRIVRSLATTFIPYPLLLSIFSKANFINSAVFKVFAKICSDRPFIKYLGYGYCVILKNDHT